MKSTDKNFGLILFACFGLYGIFKINESQWILGLVFICSALFFLGLAMLYPTVLSPFRKSWIKLGFILQQISTPIIMSLVFLFIFCPIGLLRKLFVKNNFNLKYDVESETYWEEIKINSQSTMKSQF
jgi:membrane protease YdiL (CAAX protease family)